MHIHEIGNPEPMMVTGTVSSRLILNRVEIDEAQIEKAMGSVLDSKPLKLKVEEDLKEMHRQMLRGLGVPVEMTSTWPEPRGGDTQAPFVQERLGRPFYEKPEHGDEMSKRNNESYRPGQVFRSRNKDPTRFMIIAEVPDEPELGNTVYTLMEERRADGRFAVRARSRAVSTVRKHWEEVTTQSAVACPPLEPGRLAVTGSGKYPFVVERYLPDGSVEGVHWWNGAGDAGTSLKHVSQLPWLESGEVICPKTLSETYRAMSSGKLVPNYDYRRIEPEPALPEIRERQVWRFKANKGAKERFLVIAEKPGDGAELCKVLTESLSTTTNAAGVQRTRYVVQAVLKNISLLHKQWELVTPENVRGLSRPFEVGQLAVPMNGHGATIIQSQEAEFCSKHVDFRGRVTEDHPSKEIFHGLVNSAGCVCALQDTWSYLRTKGYSVIGYDYDAPVPAKGEEAATAKEDAVGLEAGQVWVKRDRRGTNDLYAVICLVGNKVLRVIREKIAENGDYYVEAEPMPATDLTEFYELVDRRSATELNARRTAEVGQLARTMTGNELGVITHWDETEPSTPYGVTADRVSVALRRTVFSGWPSAAVSPLDTGRLDSLWVALRCAAIKLGEHYKRGSEPHRQKEAKQEMSAEFEAGDLFVREFTHTRTGERIVTYMVISKTYANGTYDSIREEYNPTTGGYDLVPANRVLRELEDHEWWTPAPNVPKEREKAVGQLALTPTGELMVVSAPTADIGFYWNNGTFTTAEVGGDVANPQLWDAGVLVESIRQLADKVAEGEVAAALLKVRAAGPRARTPEVGDYVSSKDALDPAIRRVLSFGVDKSGRPTLRSISQVGRVLRRKYGSFEEMNDALSITADRPADVDKLDERWSSYMLRRPAELLRSGMQYEVVRGVSRTVVSVEIDDHNQELIVTARLPSGQETRHAADPEYWLRALRAHKLAKTRRETDNIEDAVEVPNQDTQETTMARRTPAGTPSDTPAVAGDAEGLAKSLTKGMDPAAAFHEKAKSDRREMASLGVKLAAARKGQETALAGLKAKFPDVAAYLDANPKIQAAVIAAMPWITSRVSEFVRQRELTRIAEENGWALGPNWEEDPEIVEALNKSVVWRISGTTMNTSNLLIAINTEEAAYELFTYLLEQAGGLFILFKEIFMISDEDAIEAAGLLSDDPATLLRGLDSSKDRAAEVVKAEAG